MSSTSSKPNVQRSGGGKRKGRAQAGRTGMRIDWRDRQTWLAIILIAAVGFAASYALWMNTWRRDLAQEHNLYVSSAVARLREARTLLDTCAGRIATANAPGDATVSLVQFGEAAGRLQATLAQIPRRGPVDWKADMIGFANALQARIAPAVLRQVAKADAALLSSVATAAPALRKAMEDLDKALVATIDSAAGQGVPKVKLTTETLAALRTAIAAAKQAAEALPQ